MKINYIFQSKNICLGTCTGLIKKINEDKIGIRISGKTTKVCVCDGHWGKEAATLAKKVCLADKFPRSKQTSIKLVAEIQKEIFEKFGFKNMDPERDFTPETSLLAIKINSKKQLSIVSYGDCRLIITRKSKLIFKLKTNQTWLGAFSFLGIRHRIPVKKATIYKSIICESGDTILLFTDGIDECKYEHPTIPLKWLALIVTENIKPKIILSKIFSKVRYYGAEDNASIAIIKC